MCIKFVLCMHAGKGNYETTAMNFPETLMKAKEDMKANLLLPKILLNNDTSLIYSLHSSIIWKSLFTPYHFEEGQREKKDSLSSM